MTQSEMILRYMHENGSITPLDAMREFGCMRLGARIYELKQAGTRIIKENQTAKNRYGESVTYARYRLG